jgi:hypothetical protein
VAQKISSNPAKLACQTITKMTTAILPLDEVHRIANLEQLKELYLIDSDAYQECSIPFEVFELWWSSYEPGLNVISRKNKIIASIGIFPISVEQYQDFTKGRITESDLLPVSLEECEETPQHCWYFSGIVISPNIRGTKAAPLKLLLWAGLGQWAGSSYISYPAQCCALGYSQEGQLMLKRFGFSSIPESESFPDGCPVFSLSFSSMEEVLHVMSLRGI